MPVNDVAPRLSVLHIFKVYHPDLFGGIPSVIRDICTGLKNTFAARILVCSKSDGQRQIVVNDVPVERVRSFGDLLSLPVAPTYPLRLWHRIAEHDLLALHAPFPLADLVFALGFGGNRPLVVHWHADIVSRARLRWLVEPLIRRTLRRAKAIIVSDSILVGGTPLLREFAGKCHAVPFGVDTSKYEWPPLRLDHVNDRGRLVLACGRLVPYKGFDVLVRAAVGQCFKVWIIGEGRERARLEQLIRDLGVEDRVRLIGSVPDSELVEIMRIADVFVMPSVTGAETFGLVQLEAMAAGRPIINTALDTAVPHVARHGVEAITVPPRDPEKLAEAINTLIGDPELRRRMGEAARHRAMTKYAMATFQEGIETIYRRVVASSPPARTSRRATTGLLGVIESAATCLRTRTDPEREERMKKILVVSEALGEPNHKRGIFHFTRELVRSLAAEGHELTLLVEATRRYSKLRRRQQRARLFPEDSRLIELLALYRVLDEADMSEPTTRSSLRRSIDWFRQRIHRALSWESGSCFLRAIGLWRLRARLIENRTEGLAYIPADLRHLQLFRYFLIEPGLYTYQDTSALSLLPPPRIDARGYDIILVDSPTRVAIKRNPDARVICVVHDLLPLTDLKLSDVATRLFLSRLVTSLHEADELAFVSHYSMNRFRELFPQFLHLPARVVYPRTRFDSSQAAPGLSPVASPVRPTFVVIVSTEPRKNLTAMVRAFRKLPQADLVVIGYTGTGGANLMRNLPPNVRFAGYVEEHEKAALISEAHGLIMPSLAEGFGVPIIEALAANTPVLCSDIPVFREVAGELAEYFDPFSTESICASVTRMLSHHEEWRRKIRERRDELAQRFGYQTQARDFLARALAEGTIAAAENSAGSSALNGLVEQPPVTRLEPIA
jgi:glycosyltransferase involved in cell wall biosynthesis